MRKELCLNLAFVILGLSQFSFSLLRGPVYAKHAGLCFSEKFPPAITGGFLKLTLPFTFKQTIQDK